MIGFSASFRIPRRGDGVERKEEPYPALRLNTVPLCRLLGGGCLGERFSVRLRPCSPQKQRGLRVGRRGLARCRSGGAVLLLLPAELLDAVHPLPEEPRLDLLLQLHRPIMELGCRVPVDG